MKFSVLMSIYKNDSADFFSAALESVSTLQTVKPSQIVIVEDGPVDFTIEEIISKSQECNPEITYTVIRKEKNQGLASALNTGIKVCENEWIARMDSDDIAVNDRFKMQVEYLQNNPMVSVVGGFISEFDNDPNLSISKRTVPINHSDIYTMLKTRNPMNHMTIMYRKDKVESVGCYTENFGQLEDYKLWVDMISNGIVFANISEVLVNVRVGNGFIERRSNKKEIHDWDNLQDVLVKNKIISNFKSLTNKIYIRGFIYMPKLIKKYVYKYFLRG